MSPQTPALGAVILAGGASRRMGRDKARLDWAGRGAVERLAALARAAGADAVVVAGPDGFGLPAIADARADAGPCEGIRRGIAALAARGARRALILAIDAASLRPADIAPLIAAAGPGAAYAGLNLPMVIDIAACPPIAAGQPVRRLIDAAGLSRPAPPAGAMARLRGANSPAEFEALVRALAQDEGQKA